ncbi:MAG: hypothetical protein RL238_664 [Actinomycetota bacterium]
MQRAWSPVERLRRGADAAIVVGVTAVGWAGMAAARTATDADAAPLTVLSAVVAAVATLPVLWRRRWPLGMLGAALVLVVLAGAIVEPGLFGAQIAALGVVLLFAVGAWSERRWVAATVVLALLVLAAVSAVHDGGAVAASTAFAFALVALPAVLGYAARTRRQYLAEVEARLAAAERDRDERARVAVVEERQRIARELHDVVAHHVSLIGVQAGAARSWLTVAPDRAAAALSAIEESSRSAVGEMRQLLDVLSPRNGLVPPQPDLTAVPVLVGHWRASGVHVEAQFIGDPGRVAPTVSACAYRIVEEALTNVERHSAAWSATVRVEIDESVRVEVTDPGPPRPASDDRGTGRGLAGMRERVELCGGALEAGRVADGSFRVVATMSAVPA